MYLKSYLIMGACPFALDGSSSLLSLVVCIIPISCSSMYAWGKFLKMQHHRELQLLKYLIIFLSISRYS